MVKFFYACFIVCFYVYDRFIHFVYLYVFIIVFILLFLACFALDHLSELIFLVKLDLQKLLVRLHLYIRVFIARCER